MNITFFIGNGFDLNLGLKTRYQDFYKYFHEHGTSNNMIKEWINEKEKLWSDLEEALGRSLSNIGEDNLDKFYEDKDEMDDLLIEYLKKEQEKYDYDDEDIKKQLINSVDDFDENLPREEKEFIKKRKETYGSSSIVYNFVSFNYTNCIDMMVDIQKKDSSVINTHTYGNNSYSTSSILGQVYHIHGTVNEGMILGVNDESQINNEFLKTHEEFCDGFIKMHMNKLIGQQKTEEVKNLISSSRIICLFGISIGATDKIWWEEIVNWLLHDSGNLLIIFWKDYEHLNDNKLPAKTIRNNNRIKNRFLEIGQGKFTEEELKSAKERIFVKFNDEDMFNFPKYRGDKQYSNELFTLRLDKKRKNNYY